MVKGTDYRNFETKKAGMPKKLEANGHCVSTGSTTKPAEMTISTIYGGFESLNHRTFFFLDILALCERGL